VALAPRSAAREQQNPGGIMSRTGHLFSRTLPCTVLASLLGSAAAHAQQSHEYMTCRAGTVSVLAQADKMIVWTLDHHGVSTSDDPKSPFHGFTQRCVGVVGNIEGAAAANGWCKNVDPSTGDWTVVDWTGSGKPGHGTWSFRYGSGKWKGVTGGGTYEPIGPTKPVTPGTYQNCVRIKGTMKLPG